MQDKLKPIRNVLEMYSDGELHGNLPAISALNALSDVEKTIEVFVDALKCTLSYMANPYANKGNMSPAARIIIKKAQSALASVEGV